MSSASGQKPLGFAITVDPEEERRNLIRETRNLLLVLAVFLTVVVGGIMLYKGGVLSEHRIRLKPAHKQQGLRPKAQEVPLEAVRVAAPEEPLFPVELKDGWYRLEGIAVEMIVKGEAGKTEQVEDERDGWLKESWVETLPAGFEGAMESRGTALKIVWGISGLCLVVGLLMPQIAVPFFKLWMLVLVAPLGWFNTRLLLSLVFYLLIFPIAAVMRIFGSDPLDRKLDNEKASYWMEKKELDAEHFHHSF